MQTGAYQAEAGAGSGANTLLKVGAGAGAETNSFGLNCPLFLHTNHSVTDSELFGCMVTDPDPTYYRGIFGFNNEHRGTPYKYELRR